MKRCLMSFLWLTLFGIVFYFLFINGSSENGLREKNKIPITLGIVTTEEFKNYKLSIYGFGFESEKITGNHLLSKIKLSMAYKGLINIREARKLLVDFAESYVKKIIENKEFEKYLNKKPFSVNEAELSFISIDYEKPYMPYVYTIDLLNGVVTYETFDPDEPQFSNYEKETYEEARRIVQEMEIKQNSDIEPTSARSK